MLIVLHSASYLAFSMVLRLSAKSRFEQPEESSINHLLLTEPDEELASFKSSMARDMLSNALPMAYAAAQLLRDFRERYGLKITPAWLLQLQAVTAGVLLLDPELKGTPYTISAKTTDSGTIQDSHAAFDETFRCLLGTGVEVMVARGIARMMYHTALEMNVTFSSRARSLLQIMSDTAWRPSDLSLVNSTFPNFATDGRMTELLSRWEKLEI